MAASEFIQRQKNKQLFEKINAAYDDSSDDSKRKLRKAMKVKHHQLLEKEQW